MTGDAGIGKRGLWVDDKDTGTSIRLGHVSYEMAATFAQQGNARLAREALSKPHIGFWVSKTF